MASQENRYTDMTPRGFRREQRCGADRLPPRKRVGRFVVGLVALALFTSFFASGVTPPGICGEVLRHNQQCDIDASPLLYQEVEHMAELEARVARLMSPPDASENH